MVSDNFLREKYIGLSLPYTMTQAPRLESLWGILELVVGKNGLSGDCVEAGVYRGGSSMLMAYYLKECGSSKRLYLFDTFKGMTKPTSRDKKIGRDSNYLDKWDRCNKGDYVDWCYGSLEEVQNNLRKTKYDPIEYIQGDVSITAPCSFIEEICVLRIDTDFYESTKSVMNSLFGRVVDGGFVVFDDYGCWKGARDAVDEYFDSHGLDKKDITPVDHSCAIYQVGAKI